MLVEVRPLPEKKWHGKKGKESFAQPKTIEALYDVNTGKYATGLTQDEATEYSKKLGVDLSDTFVPDKPHPYWSTKAAQIKLLNQTMLFDTDKPADFVKVKLMKANKLVANSMKEYEENKFPDATHVIYDEAEQVQMKAGKVQKKHQAIAKVAKMTADDKIAMVQILSSKSVKGRSADFIDVEIDDIIENNVDEFLKYAGMGREEVTIRAQVLEMISKNILTKESGSIYYMGEMIALDYEAAIEWFKNPQNSKMKVAILEKLDK